jgi:MFS superfamily sulfate permease-like transporter
VCFLSTVVFDMVVAVVAGVLLASLLFMRRMAEVSEVRLIGDHDPNRMRGLPKGVVHYDIGGPLFFGAAQKAMQELEVVGRHYWAVVLDLEDVPAIDATGHRQPRVRAQAPGPPQHARRPQRRARNSPSTPSTKAEHAHRTGGTSPSVRPCRRPSSS